MVIIMRKNFLNWYNFVDLKISFGIKYKIYPNNNRILDMTGIYKCLTYTFHLTFMISVLNYYCYCCHLKIF